MKITAAISWYDESETWLTRTIASAARICDHVLAVDGAYAHYPRDPHGSSGSLQHRAIMEAAEGAGVSVTIHVPGSPWRGNQVEKRDRMMRLASFLSDPGDWILVLDADEVVTRAPTKDLVLAELAETELDVADVAMANRHDHYSWQPVGVDDWPPEKILPDTGGPSRSEHRIRRLFRARPDLRVEGTHFHYRIGPDDAPVELWRFKGSAPAADLTSVVLEHRHEYRDRERREAGERFYEIRSTLGLESPPVDSPMRRR